MADLKLIKSQSVEDFDADVRRHRLDVTIRVLLILAVLFVIAFLIKRYFDTRNFTGYEIIKKTVRSDSDTAEYMVYNGHILKYSQDGAESFDETDKANWNVTYEMQNPKIATCGDYVAMSDAGSTEILVMDPNGNQTAIQTKLPVMNFSVAGQGVVAAVLEEGNTTRINVYDKTGTQLAGIKCTMAKSGYPADIALSPGGTLLGVTYIRMENDSLRSSVAFYNFGDVGQNEIDNYVSGYDYDGTVIPRIKFLNNRTAVAVGDNKMILYKGDQKPEALSANNIENEIESVFYGPDEVALVFRADSGANHYIMDIYSDTGKLKLSQDFEMAYTDIKLTSDRAIVYNESTCEIFDMKGKVKYDGLFEDSVFLLAPTTNPTRFVLVNRNLTQLIQLN
ncbi:hypothetical protein SAMN06296386_1133 [Lachnospiraceae bacterium]|nr:hypothetical protein SAMN06296386_1133 [Lachnospiraceae bacterium]